VFSEQSLAGVVLLIQILITYPLKTTVVKKSNKIIVEKVAGFFIKSKHEFDLRGTVLVTKPLWGPNTGGGGGGANENGVGENGGSGIVIVKYVTPL
jgi:uncharacterized membrane protein YgcG